MTTGSHKHRHLSWYHLAFSQTLLQSWWKQDLLLNWTFSSKPTTYHRLCYFADKCIFTNVIWNFTDMHTWYTFYRHAYLVHILQTCIPGTCFIDTHTWYIFYRHAHLVHILQTHTSGTYSHIQCSAKIYHTSIYLITCISFAAVHMIFPPFSWLFSA